MKISYDDVNTMLEIYRNFEERSGEKEKPIFSYLQNDLKEKVNHELIIADLSAVTDD